MLKTGSLIVLLGLAALPPAHAGEGGLLKAELKPAALAAFDAYMRAAEARLRYDEHGGVLHAGFDGG